MIVKENVNQNSLNIMKNTAIFQNNTKNKAKKLLQHGWKSYKKS
ncbi:hypothetical protein [Methanobrevibacter oralis]|nr:hypothetical protein [Methanobrevibacter oralis]